MAGFFKNKNNDYNSPNAQDFFGGYDSNQYISDGHDYFNNYDYMGDEYSFNNQQQYNNGYADNSEYQYNPYGNYYGNSGYADNGMYNNMSSGVYGVDTNSNGYSSNAYNEYQYQQNSYGYSDNIYDTRCIPTQDIAFEDTFVLQNQYFENEEDEKLFTFKDFLSLGICIVFAFILAYLITKYVAIHTMVEGQSMNYNLNNGDILIIDKLSYNFNEPERFDIIVFPILTEENTYYIKRIIGLPNETVEIDDDGNIFINGVLLNENYGWEQINNPGENNTVVLGDDEYYVLGDNRNHSDDSRTTRVGNVHKENIVGKAIFRLWKIEDFGQIDNLKNAKIKAGTAVPPEE